VNGNVLFHKHWYKFLWVSKKLYDKDIMHQGSKSTFQHENDFASKLAPGLATQAALCDSFTISPSRAQTCRMQNFGSSGKSVGGLTVV
jgi:hypothetical protein